VRAVLAVATILTVVLGLDAAEAAGINTDVALPVHQGGFVFRGQLRYRRLANDPTPLGRETTVWAAPLVVLYGVTSRTTVIGALPYVFASNKSNPAGAPVEDHRSGLADLRLVVRQTIFVRDGVQRTSRLGLLGGLEIPSGSEAFSSNTTQYLLGGVYTLQHGRHELDVDNVWTLNGEANGVNTGDEYQADAAYQLRVAPWNWPERGAPAQVYGVLEANWSLRQRSDVGGARVADSGGSLLFLSPGLQLVTRQVIYEASLQIPVMRDLDGGQLEPNLGASLGLRVNY
jgi:hypothetical protein